MFALCFGPKGLFAQGTTATVEGTISDATGAAVPEASVVVRNRPTNSMMESHEARVRGEPRLATAFDD